MQMTRMILPIDGLGCWGSGALVVERVLAKAPGVARVYVNPATEMAYVEYDAAATDPEHLAAAVTRAGFGVEQPLAR
jgi:copper chaperone CopZ